MGIKLPKKPLALKGKGAQKEPAPPPEPVVQPHASPDDGPVDDSIHTPHPSEDMATGEINEILSAFKQRATTERDRVLDATDSEYWLAFGFDSRAAKHEFMRLWGLEHNESKYVHGARFSAKHGKPLTTPVNPIPKQRFRRNLHILAAPLKASAPPTEGVLVAPDDSEDDF